MVQSFATIAETNSIMPGASKTVISIVGPTAIGKTALSIELAKALQTEIISADSRQFFKEMSVGTAVPSEKELAAAPHHFIQHISIKEEYSVGDFERDALLQAEEIFKTRDTLILVGGSGLYTRSFLKGLDDFPEVDPGMREKLNLNLQEKGLEPLKKQLQELDPEYYQKVDFNNPHRLVRALEICLGTGRPYSSFLNKKKNNRNFEIISIGLTAPREIIYQRINLRGDQMMEAGLLEEAKKLFSFRSLNALNTVGYKELFQYLDGQNSLEEAIEEIKKNTRRFAKRQLTWFRKEKDITWFNYQTPAEEIIGYIESHLMESSI